MSWEYGKDATINIMYRDSSVYNTIEVHSWELCFDGRVLQLLTIDNDIISYTMSNIKHFKVIKQK